jgi:hypothetical protein
MSFTPSVKIEIEIRTTPTNEMPPSLKGIPNKPFIIYILHASHLESIFYSHHPPLNPSIKKS